RTIDAACGFALLALEPLRNASPAHEADNRSADNAGSRRRGGLRLGLLLLRRRQSIAQLCELRGEALLDLLHVRLRFPCCSGTATREEGLWSLVRAPRKGEVGVDIDGHLDGA